MEFMELFNLLAEPCYIGGAAGEAGAVKISGTIVGIFKFLVTAIKIGVPVLLLIWGSWDLGKAVMAQKEDEIKNAQKLFIKKLVIALCVFLVPSFIQIALGVISEDNTGTQACLSQIFGNDAPAGDAEE